MGKRNFKSAAAYKRWLGYGHASGEFAKTPGHQQVSIRGKKKEVKHKKTGGKYQAAGPFRDDAANKALKNAGMTFGASALTRGVVSPLMQNRRADKAAYNQYMEVLDKAYQNAGYDSYSDYCLTGDCPQNPFQGNPPTFKDWRSNDYFEKNNSRPTYRFINDVKENPLEGQLGPAIKKGAKDAAISGALTYGANKLLDNTKFGRNLKRNFNVNLGFSRSYQAAGATNNYALPTNAVTTSTMTAMASPEVMQNLETAEREREISNRERRLNERAERLEQEAAAQQEFNQAVQTQGSKLSAALPNIQAGVQIGRGTADAGKIAKASKDTTQLLSNLGAYGQGAKAGLGTTLKGMGPGVGGAALGLAGAGVKKLSDDADATTMNVGETAGTLMQGAGTGLGAAGILGGLGATGLGLPLAAVGALGYGIHGLVQRNKARAAEERKEAEQTELDLEENRQYSDLLRRSREVQGTDEGFNIGSSMSNSYLPGNQMFKAGGVNLPGGVMRNLPGGAKEFIGNKHSNGGIMLDENTEVEGGETMDTVDMKGQGPQDYIFSEYLKLGGKSFAQRHKDILQKGGSKLEIQRLAKLQEQVAKKEGRDENGPRGPERIAQKGGVVEYQAGDAIEREILPMVPEQQSQDPTTGLYYREGQDFDLQKTIEDNPWYDWSDFDPSNKEDVLDFQKQYNKEIKDRGLDEKGWPSIREDSKFGEQTSSVYLGPRGVEKLDPKGPPKNELPKAELQGSPKEVGDIPMTEVPDELKPPTLLPSVVPLLGAAAQWPRTTPLKDPKAVKAAPVGKQRLGRINMNAERAAGEAGRIAMSKAAETLGGPASFAAKIAGNQQARSNAINIANQEARQNIGLAAQEAGMNQRADMSNAANQLRAGMFNRQRQDAVDSENYLQKNLDRVRKGEIVADTLNTYQQLAADERLARANDPFGSYERLRNVEAMKLRGMIPGNRFSGMNNADRRDLAAQMYTNQMSPNQLFQAEQDAYVTAMQEPAQEATETKKKGGYIKRSNKVRRKRKK